MLAAYREFESRVGTLSTARGAKTEMVTQAFEKMPASFRLVELEAICPNVTRDMIRVVLNRLKSEGRVEAVGRGAAARWNKANLASSELRRIELFVQNRDAPDAVNAKHATRFAPEIPGAEITRFAFTK